MGALVPRPDYDLSRVRVAGSTAHARRLRIAVTSHRKQTFDMDWSKPTPAAVDLPLHG
jgi:hypothetical protein